jgi:hypothetical protein
MIPDIAIGAILAATIGAMLSLVGLIVAKESKVSEFRQAWIDSLRSELASFASNLNALSDANLIDFDTDAERFAAVKDQTGKLNEAYYSIALRLNVEEKASVAVQSSMLKLSKAVKDPLLASALDFSKEQGQFIKFSNDLLKKEWNRVKVGEKIYQRTRMIAVGVISFFFIAIGAMIFVNYAHRKTISAKSGQSEAVTVVQKLIKPSVVEQEEKVKTEPAAVIESITSQAAASKTTDGKTVKGKGK